MRFSDLKKLNRPDQPGDPAREERKPLRPPQPVPEPAPARAVEPEPPPAPEPLPEPPQETARKETEEPRNFPRRASQRAAPAEDVPFAELEGPARQKYGALLSQVDAFIKALQQPYCEKYRDTLAACSMVTDTLRRNPALLTCTGYSTADDYLRGHTANTVILALAMGLRSGFSRHEMDLLGFCAMAHDIGMTGYADLYNSREPLSDEDRSRMTLHSEAGAEMLDRIVDLDYRVKDRAKRIVLQTHERSDGSGYPDRVTGEEIDPLAMIISIADAYEAITHPRSWREPVDPPEAIKQLIEREGRGFNSRAVKLLVSVLSIYPPGSLVVLSTGETARVLRVNQGLLARPLVEILLASDFTQSDPRRLDLRNHPLVSVERSMPFAELRERCRKCAAVLELSRWWKDW